MSMVVQHNLTAMNANRMLGVTTSAQAKSTEKLSSGYRINRAADDAAGLTISEKMRKQMRALDQASTNAEDGVSAVQTAEGALTEVHSMLQRMNELATQASNGTNSQSDRDAIQAEIEQLTTEIDRVAETTKFNEIYLLKGDSNGTTKTATINAHDAGLKGTLTGVGTGTATFTADIEVGGKVTIAGTEYTVLADDAETSINTATITQKTAGGASAKEEDELDLSAMTSTPGNVKFTIAGNDYTITVEDGDTGTEIASKLATEFNKNKLSAGTTAGDYTAVAAAGKITFTAAANGTVDGTALSGVAITIAPETTTAGENQIKLSDAYTAMVNELTVASSIGADAGSQATVVNNNDGSFTITEGTATVANALSFNLHVGADADMTNKINVNIETMNSKYLGIQGLNVSDDSGLAATYAIDAIADAISKVSSQRSALGAVQNRLEHTIANLDNVVENTTSAESRIRDTDMAEEMVDYSKNNILAQAGQAMLAQANQSNQGVLSLLG